eukprot:5227780-Alexandrium_andersonii.AAC.1
MAQPRFERHLPCPDLQPACAPRLASNSRRRPLRASATLGQRYRRSGLRVPEWFRAAWAWASTSMLRPNAARWRSRALHSRT